MKPSFSGETAPESSGYLFWRVSALWQRGICNLLEPLGLTHTQYVLLASLRRLEGSSQSELSKNTGCDSMTVSSVVRTLAARGLVDRREDDRDRRAKILQITAVGTSLVDKAVPMIEAFDRRFFLDRLGGRKEVFMKDLDRLAREQGPGSRGSAHKKARAMRAYNFGRLRSRVLRKKPIDRL